MKTVLLFLIRLYRRFLSPLKPPCCRFYPTCSSYAMEAITVHGAMRGGFLALVRVLKCHPFHTGGYDPVPEPHNPVCACAEKKRAASCEYSGVGTGICPECE